MFACILFGVPLGYLGTRSRFAGAITLGVSGVLQTIPGLALLVFAIPLVGVVLAPLGAESHTLGGAALLALFLYSLLPVVRNTKEGLLGVDRAVLDAAAGLGMTARQRFRMVTLPLALPVILAGVRTSAVITVGTATLAAFVGAGGLGVPILSGLSVQNLTEVWTGAVPAALLALSIDGGFALLQRHLTKNLA
jgi:osmoprotectant transport system permease protein